MATISNVQAPKYGSAASNSVTVSWTSTPTSGNLLVARAIGVAATDAGAITDWTRVKSAQYGAASGHVAIFYKVAGASEGNVTVTFTGATTTRLVIEEWSNSDGWDASDVAEKTDNTGSTVTSRSSGTTGTTAVNDELAVAVWGTGGAVTGISFTNSFTLSFEQPTGTLTFWGAHKVLSATGTVETTASWTTARLCGGCVATFKGNTGLSGTIGQTSETDSALAMGRAKALGLGINTESDSALAMGRTKALGLGINAESDSALAMSRAKALQIGMASESGTALGMGRAKQYTIGMAVESDSALGITRRLILSGTIGMAVEEETALPMLAAKIYGETFATPARKTHFEAERRDLEYTANDRETEWKVRS